MVQLTHDTVAAMSPDMQRLVGYSPTVEGLGFTGAGFPAAMLGEGGKELLSQEFDSARDTAVANYKRLLAHLEEGRRREEQEQAAGDEELSLAEMQAELEVLEARAFTTGRRIADLRRAINSSATSSKL